jgi:hypothetical protein
MHVLLSFRCWGPLKVTFGGFVLPKQSCRVVIDVKKTAPPKRSFILTQLISIDYTTHGGFCFAWVKQSVND